MQILKQSAASHKIALLYCEHFFKRAFRIPTVTMISLNLISKFFDLFNLFIFFILDIVVRKAISKIIK